MEQLDSHWTDFHEILFEYFSKIRLENSNFINIDKNKGYFTWRPIDIFLSYITQFFLEWKTFHSDVVEWK
jgi:hypothetical protein